MRLKVSVYSIVMLAFSLIHFLLGFHYIYDSIFTFNSKEADMRLTSYEDERVEFLAEYDRCNPVTKAQAAKEYFEFLKSKKNKINQFLDRSSKDGKQMDENVKEIGLLLRSITKKIGKDKKPGTHIFDFDDEPDKMDTMGLKKLKTTVGGDVISGIESGMNIYAEENEDLVDYQK